MALSFVFGLIIALAIFLITFFKVRGGITWAKSAMYMAGGIAFIMFLAGLLGRDFPPGLLQSAFDLPWPFT